MGCGSSVGAEPEPAKSALACSPEATNAERLNKISSLLDAFWGTDREESEIVEILDNCPDQQLDELITGLDLRTLVDSFDNFSCDLLDSVFFQNVNNLETKLFSWARNPSVTQSNRSRIRELFGRPLNTHQPGTGMSEKCVGGCEQVYECCQDCTQIQDFTVGPIVGSASSANSRLRLWGRGKCMSCVFDGQSHPLHCTGYIAIMDGPVLKAAMPKVDDFTAVFDVALSGAEAWCSASGVVQYRAGFIMHPPDATLNDLTEEQLSVMPIYKAQLLPGDTETGTDQDGAFSFNFGSCKYMNRLFQSEGLAQHADAGFARMEEAADTVNTRLLLLLGDQVYADCTSTVIDPADTLSEFRYAHRVAFRTPAHHRLMTKIPTAMTWDDHEIFDNFSLDRCDTQELVQQYEWARQTFLEYQLAHSPLGGAGGAVKQGPAGRAEHWYNFCAGRYLHYFMADVRGCRNNQEDKPSCLGVQQLAALKGWLSGCPVEAVKFLCIGTPVAPDIGGTDLITDFRNGHKMLKRLLGFDVPKSCGDSWSNYAGERAEILCYIRSEGIRNVVILSGDVHFGYSCKLSCPADPDFQVLQLTASPFYFPLGQLMGSMCPNHKGALKGCKFEDGAECIAEVLNHNEVDNTGHAFQNRFVNVEHFGRVTVRFDETSKLPNSLSCEFVETETTSELALERIALKHTFQLK